MRPTKQLLLGLTTNFLDSGFLMNNKNFALADRLLKISDVQAALQMSRSAVYAAIRSGGLPKPVKIGKSARWKASQIESLIHQLGA